MRSLLVGLLVVTVSGAALAAPELSDTDRQRLADGTSDNDAQLDQQDGLYVLLRNASDWKGDDFAGDAGAKTAPEPDYAFIKDKPDQARGNVYLIEGWVVKHERFPTQDNHQRDALVRAGDPDWGDQMTRWTIVTEKGNPDATVIVLFNDPNAKMADPGEKQRVRVAARFYKLWTNKAQNGKRFTYPVFVGGAAEAVDEAAADSGSTPGTTIVLVGIVAVMGAFFVIRYFLNRAGGGSQTRDRLNAIRQERERYEEEAGDEDEEADLPEDPTEALGVLSQRHESD